MLVHQYCDYWLSGVQCLWLSNYELINTAMRLVILLAKYFINVRSMTVSKLSCCSLEAIRMRVSVNGDLRALSIQLVPLMTGPSHKTLLNTVKVLECHALS